VFLETCLDVPGRRTAHFQVSTCVWSGVVSHQVFVPVGLPVRLPLPVSLSTRGSALVFLHLLVITLLISIDVNFPKDAKR